MAKSKARIDGKNVLYGYLQRDLQSSDLWLFQMMTARLITDMGIWMHPLIYQRYPLLKPYAVRDPGARGDSKKGVPDQWGAPNDVGLFRDDNSKIKGEVRSLVVRAPAHSAYEGRKVGNGFVAAHVWRRLVGSEEYAVRNPLTYSFVPNLVWLPADIAGLTDRDGSFVQQFVQATSLRIYRDCPVAEGLRPITDRSWALLEEPKGVPLDATADPKEINFFEPSNSWLKRRFRELEAVIDGLKRVKSGKSPGEKVVSTRYTSGLPKVAKKHLSSLEDRLVEYRDAVLEASELNS